MSDARHKEVWRAATMRSKIGRRIFLEMANNFFDNLGTLFDLLVGDVFLCEAYLTLTLETPLLQHLLTILVFLQAGYVAELELRVSWDICLSSKDHHVADEGSAYKRIAAMIYIGGAYPNTDGARFFIL